MAKEDKICSCWSGLLESVCKNNQDIKEEWEERFKNKFGQFYIDPEEGILDCERVDHNSKGIIASGDIENFITSLLKEQKEEFVELLRSSKMVGKDFLTEKDEFEAGQISVINSLYKKLTQQ